MKKYITFAWIFAAVGLSSCHEEKIIIAKGSIIGFVKLFDEKGIELQDKSDVKVFLDENRSVLTNAIGRFEFNNIEPGTFRVTFEKEGYGSFKRFNFIFAAGNEPAVIGDIKLIALPEIALVNHKVVNMGTQVKISGTITETDSYFFSYYFSDKPDADNSNYSSSFSYSFCCVPVTTFEHYIPLPAAASSPLYLVCYVVSKGNDQGIYNYYDYEKQKSINPAVKKLFDPVKIL